MSSKSPIFPMPEHFSDYGFDPQFDYFQVLEDARNRQREELSRSIDSLRFKLHKPTTTDLTTTPYHNNNNNNNKEKKKCRWRWWSKAFKFIFKRTEKRNSNEEDVHLARAREIRAAVSGPLYMTESQRTTPTHKSQPLAGGMMSPVGVSSGCSSPYLSLRELNMERQHWNRMMSAPASPLYLVT